MVEREAVVNLVPIFNEIICNRKIVDKYSSGKNSPRLIAIGIRWMMAQAPMASRAKRNRAAASASGGMSCNPILIETEFPPQSRARKMTRAIILVSGC